MLRLFYDTGGIGGSAGAEGRWEVLVRGDIVLRDVMEGDLPILFEHQRDPEAVRMAAFASRDHEAFMAHWTKILGDATVTKKTILVGGNVAGNLLSWERSGEREIGYWIGRSFWGQGVATEALSRFLGHVTARPLIAHVAKHNIASIRVLEKCGFAIAGEDEQFLNVGGRVIAGLVMRLA
jgi:RimJ/RimL family protein N-acetyltransferase